jgi:tetratricopeptide (TPR) repeat protein
VDHVRLFRNDPRLRWKYRVHEQILLSIREASGETRWSDVVIHHIGYQDPRNRGAKLERDLRLLQLENTENPEDPFTLFNLGWTYHEIGNTAEAVTMLKRSLAKSAPEDSIVRKIYALLTQCHASLGQTHEAFTVCREGRRLYPEDAELLFEEGVLFFKHNQMAAAEACFTQLTSLRPSEHFSSVDAGLRSYRPRQYLGSICQAQNRIAEAFEHWRAVIAERPNDVPALTGLAELHLANGDWPNLEQICEQLCKLPNGRLEGEVTLARSLLARKEFARALAQLDATCSAYPGSIWPRVVRSHVLLQDGRDLAAAEQALNDVLQLAPEDAKARHNLALLRERRKST